ADAHRLIGTAGGGFGVVVVAGVAGDPVVAAGGGDRAAMRGRQVAARRNRHGPVRGEPFAFALGVLVELPADRAAGVLAAHARDRGLVLVALTDGALLWALSLHDALPILADAHRLIGAAGGGFGVVVVAGVAGDPVVAAGGGDRA